MVMFHSYVSLPEGKSSLEFDSTTLHHLEHPVTSQVRWWEIPGTRTACWITNGEFDGVGG